MNKYRRKECVQVFRLDSSTCTTTEEKRRGGFACCSISVNQVLALFLEVCCIVSDSSAFITK